MVLQLTPAGGRLIIASDGVWDAVSTKRAARCCRGVQQPEIAAKYVVRVGVSDLTRSLLEIITKLSTTLHEIKGRG